MQANYSINSYGDLSNVLYAHQLSEAYSINNKIIGLEVGRDLTKGAGYLVPIGSIMAAIAIAIMVYVIAHYFISPPFVDPFCYPVKFIVCSSLVGAGSCIGTSLLMASNLCSLVRKNILRKKLDAQDVEKILSPIYAGVEATIKEVAHLEDKSSLTPVWRECRLQELQRQKAILKSIMSPSNTVQRDDYIGNDQL